jgi:glutamate carboxypeptidase
MMDAARLLDTCRDRQNWLLGTIDTIVRLESPTDDKAAVDRCGDALAALLAELGGRVSRVMTSTAGNHVRAEFGAGTHQVLLLGHFDTVWPVGQLETMPLVQDGDRLSGPGVFDMKAGIAIGMLAVRTLFDIGPDLDGRIVMLWTSDEETGSDTSRALIESEAQRSTAVLVLEPSLPGGALKTSRKGCGDYEIVVEGEPAHAGVDPGKGVSAIRELARQILAVEALQDLERGVSVNVGMMSGGSRTNVVPAHARALVDVRAATPADAAHVHAAMTSLAPQLPGARLEVRGGFSRPPMERTGAVAELFELARAVGRDLGQSLEEGATGGGSDGNFTAALGIPTLDGLGAIGDGAHARHEHVIVPLLAPRAALVAGLLGRLLDRARPVSS